MLFDQCPGLLARFRRGEPAALEQVYRAYVPSVRQVAALVLRRFTGPDGWRRMAAEVGDVVSEVFIRAFAPQTRERFDGIRSYGPFLRQIAQHVAIDYLRLNDWSVINALALDPESMIAPDSDPFERFARAETEATVMGFITRLRPLERRVHNALYVQGLSQRQAADSLGIGRQILRTVDASLRDGLRRRFDQGLVRGGHVRPGIELSQPKTAWAPNK